MRARPDGLARKIVQSLIFRIAEHQPIAGIPQDESLGNGFDRLPQSLVGGRRGLRLTLALGHVESDPDQAEAAAFLVLDDFSALAQPDPASVGSAHAELDLDAFAAALGGEAHDSREAPVLGMHQRLQIRDRP